MRVGNDSSEAVIGTYRAVVGSLGAGVTIVWPAQRPSGELCLGANKGVFLFYAEPRLLIERGIKDFFGVNSEICVRWLEFLACGILPLVSLGHDNDVLALSEWISKKGNWPHDDL